MSKKITIVVDNQVSSNLTPEHGFSVLIESGDNRILLDTGQGGALAANALALSVDLGMTNTLVLSHGHYDHTGGIPQMIETASGLQCYCHPGSFQPRYAVTNGSPRAIHMPEAAKAAMTRLPSRQLHWVSKPYMLSENIGLTGPIPRETDYEDTGGAFFLDPLGKRPDPIVDDLALWLYTNNGIVVLTGCCHSGVVNTAHHIRHLTGNKHIHAIIGGFHLLHASPERIEKTGKALMSLGVERVIPCHCTGKSAISTLQTILGDRVVPGYSGMMVEF
jgi:7,8-dihydropterin-6-yl-methyl-4-(beta-D-ribofuranosyl)aminobenzene 5'-phosphate synthase